MASIISEYANKEPVIITLFILFGSILLNHAGVYEFIGYLKGNKIGFKPKPSFNYKRQLYESEDVKAKLKYWKYRRVVRSLRFWK